MGRITPIGLEQWPYSDLHTLNLDWILHRMRVFEDTYNRLENIIEDIVGEKLEEVIYEVVLDKLGFVNVVNPPAPMEGLDNTGQEDNAEKFRVMMIEGLKRGFCRYYFPSGTYSFSPITLPKGVVVVGECRYDTIFLLRGASDNALINGVLDKVQIANLTLNGNVGSQAVPRNVIDVDCEDVEIIGCDIINGNINVDLHITGGLNRLCNVRLGAYRDVSIRATGQEGRLNIACLETEEYTGIEPHGVLVNTCDKVYISNWINRSTAEPLINNAANGGVVECQTTGALNVENTGRHMLIWVHPGTLEVGLGSVKANVDGDVIITGGDVSGSFTSVNGNIVGDVAVDVGGGVTVDVHGDSVIDRDGSYVDKIAGDVTVTTDHNMTVGVNGHQQINAGSVTRSVVGKDRVIAHEFNGNYGSVGIVSGSCTRSVTGKDVLDVVGNVGVRVDGGVDVVVGKVDADIDGDITVDVGGSVSESITGNLDIAYDVGSETATVKTLNVDNVHVDGQVIDIDGVTMDVRETGKVDVHAGDFALDSSKDIVLGAAGSMYVRADRGVYSCQGGYTRQIGGDVVSTIAGVVDSYAGGDVRVDVGGGARASVRGDCRSDLGGDDRRHARGRGEYRWDKGVNVTGSVVNVNGPEGVRVRSERAVYLDAPTIAIRAGESLTWVVPTFKVGADNVDFEAYGDMEISGEDVYITAERDVIGRCGREWSENVGSKVVSVDGDVREDVGGNVVEVVTGGRTLAVAGKNEERYSGDKVVDVGGNSRETAHGNYRLEVMGKTEVESGNVTVNATDGDVIVASNTGNVSAAASRDFHMTGNDIHLNVGSDGYLWYNKRDEGLGIPIKDADGNIVYLNKAVQTKNFIAIDVRWMYTIYEYGLKEYTAPVTPALEIPDNITAYGCCLRQVNARDLILCGARYDASTNLMHMTTSLSPDSSTKLPAHEILTNFLFIMVAPDAKA